MAFDVYITVSGLCLLATPKSRDQLHVLMPVTGKQHRGCGKTEEVMKHRAVLTYNALYERVKPPPPPGKEIKNVPIERLALTFGDGSAPSANVNLDPVVADLTAASGARVPASTATGPFDPKILAARVSFYTGALAPTDTYELGDTWDFNGKSKVRLATAVRWRISIASGTHVDIRTVEGTKSLYPIDDNIAIAFFHSPPGELPGELGGPMMPPPGRGEAAPHFTAYYSLAVPPSDACPRYNNGQVRAMGIYPVTCLTATAEIA